jgi:hypothetical protein
MYETNVHDWDASFVQFVDHLFRWDTNGANEERCLFFDDNVNKLRELSFGVVIVCFAGVAADLRDKQVDTKGCIFIFEIRFDSSYL